MKCLHLVFLLPILASCGAPQSESRLEDSKPTVPLSTSSGIPDPVKTPGSLCTATDPNFDGFRYKEKIPHCARNVSNQEKDAIATAYGLPKSEYVNVEFDHYIPLSLGGSDAQDNIWPEPHPGSFEKDKLEEQLFQQLTKGTITQAAAIAEIKAWRPGSIK